MEEKPRVTGPTEKPTFSPDEVSVVFVLGGCNWSYCAEGRAADAG